jgi:hypothetical protein
VAFIGIHGRIQLSGADDYQGEIHRCNRGKGS